MRKLRNYLSKLGGAPTSWNLLHKAIRKNFDRSSTTSAEKREKEAIFMPALWSKVRKIRWFVRSSSKTMQETICLEQMGRQNMIPRKFRLVETDDSSKQMIRNKDIISPPNPLTIYH